MSIRGQAALVWWTLLFMTIFGTAWAFLIGTLPLPPATLSATEVASFYQAHSLRIRLGAAACAWTSAFTIPIAITISVQMARLERGWTLWPILQLIGGVMTTIFVVLPPILWGVAAFNPARPAEVTLLLHELACLSFATTTQYVIFQMVAIVVVCLKGTTTPHSPFPRWLGYFTAWTASMTEVAVAGFLTRTGPFAWNGLFVFWLPLAIGGIWLIVIAVLILRALKQQRLDGIPT